MATRSGDVSDYVREVVAAFDKAVNLVQKIENRNVVKSDSDAARDLYKSLALGPTIVKGYFDADSKRLGPAYMVGDYESQVQMRDVLLNLKTLIGDLSDILIEGKDVDFEMLQDASDNCRVNAGVCLGQLSQRLADPMRMHLNNPPPQYMSSIPSSGSPGLHYSSSRSTHSSSGGRFPTTPDPYRQMQSLSPQYQPRRSEYDYPTHRRNDTATSIQENYSNWSGTSQLFTERDMDELSIRRPSSTLLSAEDDAMLSPGFPKDVRPKETLLPGQQDLNRDSYTSFRKSSSPRDSAAQTNSNLSHTRERYGPDDYSPRPVEQHGPFFPERTSAQSFTSYASRAVSSNQSDLAQIQEDCTSARPEPLRLPHRPAPQQQSHQQFYEQQNPPPRKPVPAVPFESFTGHPPITKHTDMSGRVPSYIDGQRVPIPPRSDSRPKTSVGVTSQRSINQPQSQSPSAFTPSMPVQRAMQSSQTRRHHKQVSIDSSPAFFPQTSLDQPSALDTRTSIPASPEQIHNTIAEPRGGFSLLLLPENQHTPYSQNDHLNSLQIVQQPHHLNAKPYYSTIPSVPQSRAPATPHDEARPRSRHTSTNIEIDSTQSRAVATVKASSINSIPIPQNLPLSLPTEKNTNPFCKSAFRLFLGITKKSFNAATRPVGMTGYLPYWRCEKCFFEGPMATIPGPLDKKGRPGKPEKVFDPTIRECGPMISAIVGPDGHGEGSGGIRFKWAFLAKSHVPLKTPPEYGLLGRPNGTIGSYGCLFCTAEGAARGWTTAINGSGAMSLGLNGPGLNDAASTLSGVSGHSAGSGAASNTPVFGNLQLFMDHLQMHRREENWPCEEMRGRMKCVVGRVADRGEDWEINFLPL